MKSPKAKRERSSESNVHPLAVKLARFALFFFGAVCGVFGALALYTEWPQPTWPTFLLLGLCVLTVISGLFDSRSGVVASVAILFFPLN